MSTTDDNNDHQQCSDNGEITSNKKEFTSCEQNNVDDITEGISSVAILNDTSKCAACGKEKNSSDMNTCNKCQSVKYCNAACKKKHRTKHKKACQRRVAELHEEQLFKEVEPDECPICLLSLSGAERTETFQTCCGKIICSGCSYAMKMSEGKDLCAFCRTPPATSSKEETKRIHKLMDNGNGEAYYLLAGYYADGAVGMPQDHQKANELYLKGGELGSATAYYNLGNSYRQGRGVERDMKKTKYYYELAAMGGCLEARNNLGCMEGDAGNYHRAMKHFVIAAKTGYKSSMEGVKRGFQMGFVTKDDYANTLRAYQKSLDETKSDQRDEATAFYAEIFS